MISKIFREHSKPSLTSPLNRRTSSSVSGVVVPYTGQSIKNSFLWYGDVANPNPGLYGDTPKQAPKVSTSQADTLLGLSRSAGRLGGGLLITIDRYPGRYGRKISALALACAILDLGGCSLDLCSGSLLHPNLRLGSAQHVDPNLRSFV